MATIRKEKLKARFEAKGYSLDTSVYPFTVYKIIEETKLPRGLQAELSDYYDGCETSGKIK